MYVSLPPTTLVDNEILKFVTDFENTESLSIPNFTFSPPTFKVNETPEIELCINKSVSVQTIKGHFVGFGSFSDVYDCPTTL